MTACCRRDYAEPIGDLMINSFGLGLCVIGATMVPNLSAAPCSNTTRCTVRFTTPNSGSHLTGTNFGTVNLFLSGSQIIFNINLANGVRLISESPGSHRFPAAFGFNDNLSGGVTITGYTPNTYSGETTSGSYPDFGSFTNYAGVDGPDESQVSDQSSTLSFTVSRTGGFTDVNQLVALTGSSYFVAHVDCEAAECGGEGITGAVGATTVVANPEPASYFGVLSAGFGLMLFLVHKRRNRRSVVS